MSDMEGEMTDTGYEGAPAEEPGVAPTDGAGYESEAGYEEVGAPPDLSDALSQLHAHLDARVDRGVEQEGEPYDGDDEYEPELDEREAVGQLLDEAVRQRVAPVLESVEMDRREREIAGLAQQFPHLRDPDVLDAVTANLQALAETYEDPSIETDPRMVRMAYLALEAEQMANGQAQQQQPPPQPANGAALEHGAGPGMAPPQLSPEEQAYAQALSRPKLNRFGL